MRPWIGSPIGAQRLREHLDRMMRRHVARPEVHLRRAPVIARDETVQDLREEPALLVPEPAHDAEIDGDDVARLVDEQVALVHVGVEEAVPHRVREETAEHDEAERLEIVAVRAQRARDRRSARRRSSPSSARASPCASSRRRAREALVGLQVLRHLGDRRAFETEIHLELGRAGEVLDHGHGLQAARPAR